MKIMEALKQKICRHNWKTYNFFIYTPEASPKKNLSSIKKRWFYEVRQYMESIGLNDLLPYFFFECKKCGKHTIPAIDTLIKATIIDWYVPEYVWNKEDFIHAENKYPIEILMGVE